MFPSQLLNQNQNQLDLHISRAHLDTACRIEPVLEWAWESIACDTHCPVCAMVTTGIFDILPILILC